MKRQSNVTKRDLVVRISEETEFIQTDVHAVLQHFLDSLADALIRGETIELRNFGVFKVRHVKARVGRNPHEPARAIAIPPRAIVKFAAGKELSAQVERLSPRLQEKNQNQPAASVSPVAVS